MKRWMSLWVELLILPLWMSAQEPVDSISIRTLSEQMQIQTGKEVFSLVPESEKVVRPTDFSIEPVRKMLEKSGYRLSEYQNRVFILMGKDLCTSLPAVRSNMGRISYVPTITVSSGNRLYEVGSLNEEDGASPALIDGYVVNFRTGEPREGVQVVCVDSQVSVLTGKDGYFRLEIPRGYHVLEVRGMDVKNGQRRLQILGNAHLQIELEEEERVLQELVVEAGRIEKVRSAQIGVERFNPFILTNLPSTLGEADVLRMLQTIPGVKTVGEASSGFNVRGGATDQNLILFNNGTLFNPSHMFGLFTAFNSDVVQEAELYKSSVPSQYGGRISSVLNISSREASKETMSGSLSVGLLTTKMSLDLPLVKDKLSLQLNGRTTYSDWMLKLLPEKSGYRDGQAGFYDMGSVLSWNPNARNKINLYGYFSHDNFRFTQDEKYGYTNMNFSAEWKSFFNEGFWGCISGGYDHYDYYNDRDVTNRYNASRFSYALHQAFLKVNFQKTSDTHLVNAGVDTRYYNVRGGKYGPIDGADFSAALSSIEARELEWDNALESALYLNDEWEVNDRMKWEGGLRLTMFNVLGPRKVNIYANGMLPSDESLLRTEDKSGVIKTYIGPEFRLSGRYKLREDLSVKLGINTMQQFIHRVSNTSIMSPTDIWKLSDLNIKPQKGWQLAGGLYHESPTGIWEYSLEGYYKNLDNYLSYRNGAELLMNGHLETDVIHTEGYAYGVEVQAKRNAGKLTGWVSYSYSRTKIRQNDSRVAAPVNDGKWFPTEYDRPHEFKLVGTCRFTQRVNVSGDFEYSTGRPTTIPAGKYFDKSLQRMQPYYLDRNTYRVPDYMRLDLALNIAEGHHRTKLFHTTYSIGVYNVLGRRNVYNIYYTVENGEIKGYKLSIFGAPIPYLTINLNF